MYQWLCIIYIFVSYFFHRYSFGTLHNAVLQVFYPYLLFVHQLFLVLLSLLPWHPIGRHGVSLSVWVLFLPQERLQLAPLNTPHWTEQLLNSSQGAPERDDWSTQEICCTFPFFSSQATGFGRCPWIGLPVGRTNGNRRSVWGTA